MEAGDDYVRYNDPAAEASLFANQPAQGAASGYVAGGDAKAEKKNRAPCLGCVWVAFILTVAGVSAHRHLLPKILPGAHAHHVPPTPTSSCVLPPAGRPGETVINVVGGECLHGFTSPRCLHPMCGQVTMATKYVPNAVAFAKTQGWVGTAGTCASKGFTVKGACQALPPSLTPGYTSHTLTSTLFTKPVAPTPPGMTVISVVGGHAEPRFVETCGQVTLATKYVPNAVAFAKGKGWFATAGTCFAQGFAVPGAGSQVPGAKPGGDSPKGPSTMALPPSLTGYLKHALTATLYTRWPCGQYSCAGGGGVPAPPAPPRGAQTVINVIGGGTCGQVTMATAYVPKAVAFAKAHGWVGAAGTCASQGFTENAGANNQPKSKALPISLTGYIGHPLTAALYTKPSPSCGGTVPSTGYTCFKDGASFAKALNAPAKAGDKLALICPAATPCTINGTHLGSGAPVDCPNPSCPGLGNGIATVIMENVVIENNYNPLTSDTNGRGGLLYVGQGGSVTGTKLTFRNGKAA